MQRTIFILERSIIFIQLLVLLQQHVDHLVMLASEAQILQQICFITIDVKALSFDVFQHVLICSQFPQYF